MPKKRDNFARRLKEKSIEAYEAVNSKAGQATEKTREIIREHPVKSIVIAGVIGALVGAAISELVRRRKKEASFLRRLRRFI